MPGHNYVSLLHVQLVLVLFYGMVTALYLSCHRDYYWCSTQQFYNVKVCDIIVAVGTVLSLL